MTSTYDDETTVQDVLESTRELGPTIASRARDIEAARRLPRDLLDELLAAGCFRVSRPRSHGGVGADLPDTMRMIESLARADASVAWTVMIGGSTWVDMAALPRTTFDALFASPDVITAGVFNPTASIHPVPDGYEVRGRWSFASGCEHADWLFGNGVEDVVDGAPQMRMAVLAPDQVVIEDTWTVSGLSGTGSHHFRADGVTIPAENTWRPFVDPPSVDVPILRIPPLALISLLTASVPLGVAQGALDEIRDLAAAKVPLLAGAPLAANPHFQFEFASADTELRAARALLYESAEWAWATATSDGEFTLEQRARLRAAGVWVTTRSAAVVEIAYRSGGGSSIYADCPLQRRLRDVHAVTQHFVMKPDTLTTAGGVLAGQGLAGPVF
jgi:alkylation response protein AidB-like acyl-CoA dehydrogenase